jgi:hypothetical protein
MLLFPPPWTSRVRKSVSPRSRTTPSWIHLTRNCLRDRHKRRAQRLAYNVFNTPFCHALKDTYDDTFLLLARDGDIHDGCFGPRFKEGRMRKREKLAIHEWPIQGYLLGKARRVQLVRIPAGVSAI